MDEELIEISHDIFRDIIARLTLHMRFMDIALNRYVFVSDTMDFRCDGMFFHYHPVTDIKIYQNDPNKLTRGYFHVVLHSLFQHQRFAANRTMSLWDLACDIAVENVILDLDLACMRTSDDEEKRKIIANIKQALPLLTAQRIYHYLQNEEKDRIRLLSSLFQFDHHEDWYELREVTGKGESLFGDETKDDPVQQGNNQFDKASHDMDGKQSSSLKESGESQTQIVKNALQDWEKISEKIEMELELFKQEYGDETEPLIQSLKQLHKEKYDYRTFLKKFMQLGEKMEINDEEFDAIFYTYGLKLYENLPLIEPLEYKETRPLKTLVIAIDT